MNVEERLATIQLNLSLNVSELSSALSVSRPTVYAWLRTEKEPHAQNLIRIKKLHHFAKYWRSMSARPLGNLRNSVQESTGKSLVDELSAAHLDESAIRNTLTILRTATAEMPRRKSVAEIAREHGLAIVERKSLKDVDL